MTNSHLISTHDVLQNTWFLEEDWNVVLPGINWLCGIEGACLLCIHFKAVNSSNEFTSGNKRQTSAGMVYFLSLCAEEIKTHLSVEAALKGHAFINTRPRKCPSSGIVGVWCISCYRKQNTWLKRYISVHFYMCHGPFCRIPVTKFVAVFLFYCETWVIPFT